MNILEGHGSSRRAKIVPPLSGADEAKFARLLGTGLVPHCANTPRATAAEPAYVVGETSLTRAIAGN